jgi:hypothetical protein
VYVKLPLPLATGKRREISVCSSSKMGELASMVKKRLYYLILTLTNRSREQGSEGGGPTMSSSHDGKY